ncbi:spore germination protein GerPC [Paenibacillus sp. GCM10012307]|uniref:Uncharacterized protein n=1 Tax=Paenibacillus roseus TaxID=2798579 RepID=A0A934MXK4_9BACL|nr:spore germination protein GerPC [Paenibacillus roseus]MBJ6364272.1 hypothetical protein [Paenibacillus roseus]
MNQPQSSAWQSWYNWAQDTQKQLQQLQQQVTQLQQQYQSLQNQIKQTADKPTYNIERLEYHFDQLKVQRLDGTLNIGMAPPGGGSLQQSIDQLSVPGAQGLGVSPEGEEEGNASSNPEALPSNPFAPSPLYQEVYRQVSDYLDHTAPNVINQAAAASGVTLDPYHRSLIIEDMRKQLAPRIQFYMNSATKQEAASPVDQQAGSIAQKTIRDVDMAIRQYIARLPSPPSSAAAPGAETSTLPTGGTIVTEHSGVQPFEATD